MRVASGAHDSRYFCHLKFDEWVYVCLLPPQLQTAVAASPSRTLPCVTLHRAAFRTEGSFLRWEPQPHAAVPCTPYTSPPGASFKPDVAGRAFILSGRRGLHTQTMAEVARSQKCGH